MNPPAARIFSFIVVSILKVSVDSDVQMEMRGGGTSGSMSNPPNARPKKSRVALKGSDGTMRLAMSVPSKTPHAKTHTGSPISCAPSSIIWQGACAVGQNEAAEAAIAIIMTMTVALASEPKMTVAKPGKDLDMMMRSLRATNLANHEAGKAASSDRTTDGRGTRFRLHPPRNPLKSLTPKIQPFTVSGQQNQSSGPAS